MRIPSPMPACCSRFSAGVDARRPASRRRLAPAAAAAPGRLTLTVDSIMRGPDLVGYPPSGLRWSGDSRDLFFEWRKPGEKESATYVLSQNTTTPRKLTDEERKLAPPVRRRRGTRRTAASLFADGGDIVVVDTVARTRQQMTRTTAPESSPRWARNDTAVTFVSQNNLFIGPARDRLHRAVDRREAAAARDARHRQPEVRARAGGGAARSAPGRPWNRRRRTRRSARRTRSRVRDHRAPERGRS